MYNDNLIKIKIKNKVFSIKESHLHQHNDVQQYLYEALQKFLLIEKDFINEDNIKVTINLERIIGKTICINTTSLESDNFFYAQRKGRQTFTKFVKNIDAVDCSTLTLVLARKNENYKILTAYIGKMAEKEPLDPSIKTKEEFETAKQFWDNHALIAGSQKYYSNTVTQQCPWDSFENRPVIAIGNNNNISQIIATLREKSYNETNSTIKNIL